MRRLPRSLIVSRPLGALGMLVDSSEGDGMQIGRRQVLGMMGAAGVGCLLPEAQGAEQARTVYLGSFSSSGHPRGRGLEIGAVDPASGQLTVSGPVAGVADA